MLPALLGSAIVRTMLLMEDIAAPREPAAFQWICWPERAGSYATIAIPYGADAAAFGQGACRGKWRGTQPRIARDNID